MKECIEWFKYFILVCLLIGWVEVGVAWMLCHHIFTPDCFWALMSIPMSLNMCLSFTWLGVNNGY